MISTFRNDMEKELIKQGKEIFTELDRNRSDFESLLEKEAGRMDEQMLKLSSELEGKLEETNQSLHECHNEREEIRLNLKKESEERKQEKNKIYEDFEQVCRNIDERITGEKKHLLDKLNDTNESLEHLTKENAEDRNSILKLIKEEAMNREDATSKLRDEVCQQNETGQAEFEELKQLIDKESKERQSENNALSEKVDHDIANCQATSEELRNFLELENNKRRIEAEELQNKIQKEKEALREYIDNDNQVLR